MNWLLIKGTCLFGLALWSWIIVDIRKERKGLTIYHSDEYWLKAASCMPSAYFLFISCQLPGWWPVTYHSLIIIVLLASWWWMLFDGITNMINKNSFFFPGSGGARNNSEADKVLRSIGKFQALLLKVILITASTILFIYMQNGRL